jgi:CBS domain containing-hemolysin-like protein
VTVLLLLFSEILPKTTAALRPWTFSRLAARPVWGLQGALLPVVGLLDLLTRPLMRLLGRAGQRVAVPGVAELRALVSLARGGDIPDRVLKIVERGLHLADISAEEVMVPRVSTLMVERRATLTEVIQLHRRVGHSRFPVYQEEPDHTVGLLHVSDVLDVPAEEWGRIPAGRIVRPVLQVPGSTPIHELMRRMQSQAIHLAVVVDEYGGTDGIVTLEDILEEVVGAITDEQDLDREAEIVRFEEGRYRVRGSVGLAVLARETGVDLRHPLLTTVGGLIQHILGRPPRVRDQVIHRGYTLTVERMARRAVALAAVERIPSESETSAVASSVEKG